MREIKFRVWDKVRGSFIQNADLNLIHRFGEYGLVIQQYTGLKDSDGKEMYEGDIVTALSSDNKYNSVIQWDENCAGWGFKAIRTRKMSYGYNLTYGCSRWKVVGNIFETPNLLKYE